MSSFGSKYQYIRKHKLNGKKLDITNEIVGMMQINDYLLSTLPKLTKLIGEVSECINDESMTDEGKVVQVKQLFKMFEKGEFEKGEVQGVASN